MINPIRDKKKLAGGFGSYGWSGEGKKIIETNLRGLKLNYFKDGIFVRFSPSDEDLKAAEDYGEELARTIVDTQDNV